MKAILKSSISVCCLMLVFINTSYAEIVFDAADVTIGDPGFIYSTNQYSMDSLPYEIDSGHAIGKTEPRKFPFWPHKICAGIDAKVNLPVIGSMKGQSLYKINDELGVLVWAGDSNFKKPVAMSGNSWTDVFHQWCSPDSQGYSFFVHPVILKRNTSGEINVPATTIGNIKLRYISGDTTVSGKLDFSVTLNNLRIRNEAKSCRLLTPSSMNVTLATVSKYAIPHVGDEVVAGAARISLQCDENVNVWATLTDATNPSNRGDLLTLTNSSDAQGVGLKIYKDDNASALKFGPDSYIKNNINQWEFSSSEINPTVLLKAKYVNTDGNIIPGSVNGLTTFTFSYQ
ncbi:adhesin [Salmonella enterica]|nr:adhesin [Salmonella enterica]